MDAGEGRRLQAQARLWPPAPAEVVPVVMLLLLAKVDVGVVTVSVVVVVLVVTVVVVVLVSTEIWRHLEKYISFLLLLNRKPCSTHSSLKSSQRQSP